MLVPDKGVLYQVEAASHVNTYRSYLDSFSVWLVFMLLITIARHKITAMVWISIAGFHRQSFPAIPIASSRGRTKAGGTR